MKKLLMISLILPFCFISCSSKNENVDPDSTSLEGTWQLSKISAYVVPKGGTKLEGVDTGNNVVTTFTSDGKVRGKLPLMTDLDDFLSFDVENQGFDYRFEVKGDEIIVMNRAGTTDIERAYFKLSKTGNSMTWTMNMDLARKSATESKAIVVVPFDTEDLNQFDDFQMKYDFVKK